MVELENELESAREEALAAGKGYDLSPSSSQTGDSEGPGSWASVDTSNLAGMHQGADADGGAFALLVPATSVLRRSSASCTSL